MLQGRIVLKCTFQYYSAMCCDALWCIRYVTIVSVFLLHFVTCICATSCLNRDGLSYNPLFRIATRCDALRCTAMHQMCDKLRWQTDTHCLRLNILAAADNSSEVTQGVTQIQTWFNKTQIKCTTNKKTWFSTNTNMIKNKYKHHDVTKHKQDVPQIQTWFNTNTKMIKKAQIHI